MLRQVEIHNHDKDTSSVPIKVHVLNFHGIFSHIEIVLENTSTNPHTYYGLNRWETPENEWGEKAKQNIEMADSICTLEIDADPNKIVKEWKAYWEKTKDSSSILGNNCAVAAQWFLTEFAKIPAPNLSNYSANHLAMGIVWPSYIPCPITLPGRVMSNTEFYTEVKGYNSLTIEYSDLYYRTIMALAALTFTTSVVALTLAAIILSGGIAGLAIAGFSMTGFASSHVFFESNARLTAKKMALNSKNTDMVALDHKLHSTPT